MDVRFLNSSLGKIEVLSGQNILIRVVWMWCEEMLTFWVHIMLSTANQSNDFAPHLSRFIIDYSGLLFPFFSVATYICIIKRVRRPLFIAVTPAYITCFTEWSKVVCAYSSAMIICADEDVFTWFEIINLLHHIMIIFEQGT